MPQIAGKDINMGKTLKRIIVALLVIVSLFAAGIFIMTKISEKNLEGLAEIKIQEPDLNTISDGTYKGSYSAFPVSADVEVDIKGHRIEAIRLIKHDNGQGKGAETLPARVVLTQKIGQDLVSGATYSSKVILLAISDALDGE
jgi:uncharacterized protein with FMN-binding domain